MPTLLRLHQSIDTMEPLVECWQQFSQACGQRATFCHPWVWFRWFKAHPQLQPAVFEWYEEGRLLALIPMFREGPTLEMATGPHLDYQDIAATDHEAAVTALLSILEQESQQSTSMVFPKIIQRSRLGEALADPRLTELSVSEGRFFSRCPISDIYLQEQPDLLYAIPARQRKDYRNATRRLGEQYPGYEVVHLGPGHFPAPLIDEIAVLHRENQFRKKGPSVFDEEGFVAFLKQQAESDAPLCLSLIREKNNGPLMAFNLGYFSGDTYYYYITAYSEAHAACSPGRWLLVDTLRHWSQRIAGTRLRFDMLCGEEGYKFRWASHSYQVSRIVLLPRRFNNLPRILAYSTIYGLKNAKSRLLNRPRSPVIELEPLETGLPR